MKTKLSFLILAGILLLAQGCVVLPSSVSVKGDGDLVTKSIDISAYDEINMEAPSATFDYSQQQDAAPALTITVDQNIYDLYDFKTEGSKLIIRPKNRDANYRLHPTTFKIVSNSAKLKKAGIAGAVEFNVNSPLVSDEKVKFEFAGGGTINLKEKVTADEMVLELAGSGTFNAPILYVNKFKGETAGSGTFNLAGKGEKASFAIAGKGNVHASDFELSEMSCDIAGSGTIETFVNDQMRINIAGSGTVRYKGDPSIKKDIAGFGSVKKMD